MRFENALTIHAPVSEVFAYLARPENLPRWNYALDHTEQTSPGPIGVGSTYRQTRTLPRPAEEHLRITEYEPPNLLTAEGDFGPLTGTTTYRLTPLDRHTTRLANTVHLTASGAFKAVAAIAGPRVKHAVAKNLDVLKDRFEEPAAHRPPRGGRSPRHRRGIRQAGPPQEGHHATTNHHEQPVP